MLMVLHPSKMSGFYKTATVETGTNLALRVTISSNCVDCVDNRNISCKDSWIQYLKSYLGLALPLASMVSVRANFASGSREYGLKNTNLWRILTLYTLKVTLLLR